MRSHPAAPRAFHALLAIFVGIGLAPSAAAQVFTGFYSYGCGGAPSDLATGDVDHDGVCDVVLSLSTTSGFAYQRGDGSGGLLPAVVVPALSATASIGLVDLNGDGDLDAVVISPNAGKVQSYLALNGNDATSVDTVVPATAGLSVRLASADFNLDGVPDLAVTRYDAARVTVLYGQGNGAFVGLQDFDPGVIGFPSSAVAVRLDGDAYPDLVIGLAGGSSFLVLKGTNVGTFLPQPQPSSVPNAAHVAAGDFDADGKVDVVVSGNGGPNSTALLRGDGAGGFLFHSFLPVAAPVGMTVGDFDHDAQLDLVAADLSQQALLRGQGTGNFYAPVSFGNVSVGLALGTADTHSDGRLDLLVGDWASASSFVFPNVSPVSSFATPYGSGTNGCYGRLGIRTRNEPVINNPNFGITCTNAPRRSLGLLLVSDQQHVGGYDPFALGVVFHVGFSTTELYFFDAYSDLAGTSFAPAPLPNAPAIVGLTFFAQTFWAEQPMDGLACSSSPFAFVTSRGLGFTIQPAGPP